jgi:cellulose synthase/poly-beta-1,6-N-acetylglucosamine synthase-like glycosyltransferase
MKTRLRKSRDTNAWAQQRRWAKGVLQVWFKLYRRIWYANVPLRVNLEMFFRLTGNISYPLMIVASFMQFPLLVIRYNQGLYQLMMLDVPLLFFSTVSVVLFYGTAVWYLDRGRPAVCLQLDVGRRGGNRCVQRCPRLIGVT